MKVTLMIADFARVANGKLDVIGGGWSMMNAQGPFVSPPEFQSREAPVPARKRTISEQEHK